MVNGTGQAYIIGGQRPARFSFLENSRDFFFIAFSCSRSRASHLNEHLKKIGEEH